MNKYFFKNLKLILIFSLIYSSSLHSQPLRLFAVSDLKRVFEDGYELPPAYDTIRVFGIRGEIISGQCAVYAGRDQTNLTVELSTLRNLNSGRELSASAVEWNFVGSIPLTENTRNYPDASVVRKAPARFPEYLMEERQMNISKGKYQSVWLTVNIPETAEAGAYIGKVTVKSSQTEQSLPVHLTIYPLTIPSERHLNIVEWYNTRGFEKWHGIKEVYSNEWFAMLKKYAENMVSHRKNSFRVNLDVVNIKQTKEGEFTFDFSRFDQIAQVFWDTKKMDYLETGFLAMRGEKGFTDPNFRWKDITVTSAETGEKITYPGPVVIPSLVSALESHLRQKGWLNKTWFHIQDEPVLFNALSWRSFSQFIHQYAPDLIRMDAIETTFLLDDIEVAVPKLNHFASWYDVYKKAQERGVEMWFYTVGIHQGTLYPNKTIDLPVIQNRTLHWLNYKYDATGFLHWGWNQWNEDPFKEVGMHIGDGWHVYPSRNGVLNSLRWEQMRNGIQDYEYFWMLENMTIALKDSLGSRFSWIDPKQRGKEITTRVIKDFADYSNDPDVMYNAKMELINEILDFNKSPKVYVQTIPMEGPALHNKASIELFGWAEPGTTVTVNNSPLPVNDYGLFVAKVSAGKDGNIRVMADHVKGSKEIIRKVVNFP